MDENELTNGQLDAVQGLKVYVHELEYQSELELTNEEIVAVWNNFSYEEGTFLLGHLGNSTGDYNPPNQTRRLLVVF